MGIRMRDVISSWGCPRNRLAIGGSRGPIGPDAHSRSWYFAGLDRGVESGSADAKELSCLSDKYGWPARRGTGRTPAHHAHTATAPASGAGRGGSRAWRTRPRAARVPARPAPATRQCRLGDERDRAPAPAQRPGDLPELRLRPDRAGRMRPPRSGHQGQLDRTRPDHPGGLLEAWHCHRCRPSGMAVADIDCAACDSADRPLLVEHWAEELCRDRRGPGARTARTRGAALACGARGRDDVP